jgi:hypothetical protein
MSTVFEEVSIKGLRPVHFSQLLDYLYSAEESGEYYGVRKHHNQRHEDLKEWLEGIFEYSTQEGVVIPK